MNRSGSSLAALSLSTLTALACAGAAPAHDKGAGASVEATRPAPACRAPMSSDAIAVPAGNRLALELAAEGVQIYTCTAGATGPAWVLTAPEATLSRQGTAAGTHSAGPAWRSDDGSAVVGAKVAGVTPDATAIPWLLLKAASHEGDGRMSKVTFVQRVDTRGGLAPATGCDTFSLGKVARVPYTATYCFHEAN